MRTMESENIIEMLHITKEFPGIIANDDITLQLRRGEIHALLGENGAGKSTLMSVLFGLYQPEKGIIKKNGQEVKINDPNDATALGIGMVHQHFKLIEVFTVLDNIILGAETTKLGFLQKREARAKVEALSERYGLRVEGERMRFVPRIGPEREFTVQEIGWVKVSNSMTRTLYSRDGQVLAKLNANLENMILLNQYLNEHQVPLRG